MPTLHESYPGLPEPNPGSPALSSHSLMLALESTSPFLPKDAQPLAALQLGIPGHAHFPLPGLRLATGPLFDTQPHS